MSKVKYILSAFLLASLLIVAYLYIKSPISQNAGGTEIGTATDPYARQNWERMRMVDPQTNEIPENIFAREAAFAATLPQNNSSFANKKAADWLQRGPHNIGGRTRAFAFDIDNENIIITGSVTGGIYRSQDGGSTWTMATTPGIMLSVTDIVQDTRPNKHNIWYACTGEIIGNLTRYPGDGIYKSTDGGKTWNGLQIAGKPQEFRYINYAWRMVLDHTRNDSDIMYLASWGAILRSNDGGQNWSVLLGGKASTAYRTGGDIAISEKGVLYATLSSNAPNGGGGIWRSTNGLQWTRIQSRDFPATHGRAVIEIFKGNENVVYLLSHTPNKGKLGESHSGSSERNSLWRYEYLSGNGADSLGVWDDRSEQIPALRQTDGYVWGDFLAQGGYNLVCRVNPRNEDSIIIGGTNLFASTDGFTTNNNTTWIGGYLKTKDRINALYNGLVYPNHHPDQHNLLFHPSNINIAFSTNDGGIQKTLSVWDKSADVVWQNLNAGYYTTQFYTIALNQNPNENHKLSDIILGGFQDNETQYVGATSATEADWNRIACCDGSYSTIFDTDDYTYVLASKQLGVIYLLKFDKDGNRVGNNRIDPTGGANYLFINPFIENPNNATKIYLAAGNFIWRNKDVTTIPLSGTDNTTDWNWERITEARTNSGVITALDCSVKPENVLYYGTSGGSLYRVDNIEVSETYIVTELTADNKALDGSGYISSIAIDPNNANAVLVCFSNYNRKSIYYTEDGGQNWRDVSGNLEENSDGTGAGPGCNVVKIIRDLDNNPIYLVGTTSGLFSTSGLPGTATVWNKESNDIIGNCSVRDIDYRAKDNLLILGTHGCGSFSTTLDKVAGFEQVADINFKLYPNPATDILYYDLPENAKEISLYDLTGKTVLTIKPMVSTGNIEVNNLPKGTYILKAFLQNKTISQKIIIE